MIKSSREQGQQDYKKNAKDAGDRVKMAATQGAAKNPGRKRKVSLPNEEAKSL